MESKVEKLNALTKHNTFNYLDDPLISAYFLSKEVVAYYLSLKHVDVKRDFHEQLISSIRDFLSLADETSIRILNFYIFSKNERKSLNVTNIDSLATVESIHPEGYGLLAIKLPLTLDSLKKNYKKAAMKYHPDRGGSIEKMVMINEAYTAYQDYLCSNLKESGSILNQEFEGNYDSVPSDANDYIYLLNSLLSQVYCDDWDLLNSYRTIKKLQDQEFYQSKLIETGEEVFKLVKMASTLTKRLAVANRNSEAKEMMEFTKYVYEIGNLDYKPYLEEPENIINGVKTLRVVINHLRQADNALLNGVISKKRYESLLGRFRKKKEVEINKAVILNEFLDSCGFIERLAYDNCLSRISSKSTNIPEVGYFEEKKLHNLSKDQQFEYFLAFSNKSSLNLVRKYTHIRLASYILSIELENNEKLIDNICNECVLLSNVFDTSQAKHSSTKELIENLTVDIKKIRNLSGLDRKKQVDVIKSRFFSIEATASPTIESDFSRQPAPRKTHKLENTLPKIETITGPFGSIQLANISEGTFQMGDLTGNGTDYEQPVHTVNVPAFKLMTTPITRDHYQPCIDAGVCANPSDFGLRRGNRPVTNVSWNDAQTYIKWLKETTGLSWRLPSEAEWEYAARAGTISDYPWGSSPSPNHASYYGRLGLLRTFEVAQYPANAFGLYDMHGNVWEWVEDCWHENYQGAPSDGSVWEDGDREQRVLRGGSWGGNARGPRSSYRYWDNVSNRDDDFGFRLVQGQ